MHSTVEDTFISELIATQKLVSVYLQNGIRLKGIIVGADKSTVLLDHGFVQMVYKHRISTIEPTPTSSFQ